MSYLVIVDAGADMDPAALWQWRRRNPSENAGFRKARTQAVLLLRD